MISQIFVISPRGDNIIFRDYRGDVPKTSGEIFFRKFKFWEQEDQEPGGGNPSKPEEAPPVFHVDGVNYLYVKGAPGLLFVATTRANVSPSFVLELLQRIARVAKDYLGVLNEDSLRKNFVLVYELLDEMVDYGYPMSTSTEALKSYVFNEPFPVDSARFVPAPTTLGGAAASLFLPGTGKRVPATAVTKSVVANEPNGRKREEIFVDIIERLSVTFSASGYVSTSEVDGCIQMKSYLSASPQIRLALNEDLIIGRDAASAAAAAIGNGTSIPQYGGFGSGSSGAVGGSSRGSPVILDDCNFHQCVRLDDFDADRTLQLVPPDGEFAVMNYRTTQEFKPPFRLYATVEDIPLSGGGSGGGSSAGASYRAEVVLRLRSDFASAITANGIILRLPLPKSTQRVSHTLDQGGGGAAAGGGGRGAGGGGGGQSCEFVESTKVLEWTIKKMVGGIEHVLRAKLTLAQDRVCNVKKETGPANLSFSIPMHNASRLQVRYLQILNKEKSYNPFRWVRYVTHANSYVIRL